MSLRNKLLLSNCLPLIVFVVISLAMGLTQFRGALYDEKEGNLRSTALAALTFYNSRGYGDYNRRIDGNIWRGMNFNISEDTSIVDELKEETGVDITVFFGEEAVMTSIKKRNGARALDIQVDERMRQYVLGSGDQLWYKDITINFEDCQAYAIPIRQESDGSVVGALIASQSADGLNNIIRNYILTTAAVVVFVLAAVFAFVWWHVEWFAQKFSEVTDKSRQDLLTGLLNKLTFQSDTEAAIARRHKDDVAVLLILDFDNFKHVNDGYGHQVGDEALKSFANILLRAFRANDVIGRVGGDEFMVYMADVQAENVKRADEIAGEILKNLGAVVIGEAKNFSCSIGIGTVSGDNCDFTKLYNLADKALYVAKERGKACYVRRSCDANGDEKLEN